MSAQAKTPQSVVICTLGAHRTQRTDLDSASQIVEVDYAGSIADRTADTALTELPGSGSYLTKITTTIVEPVEITSGFRFAQAPTDEPFQRVVYRYEYMNVTLVILGGAVALFVGAVAAVVMWLSRRGRRRATAP